jgi:hypothetical protein
MVAERQEIRGSFRAFGNKGRPTFLLIDCFGAARLVLAAQHGQSAAVPAVDSHKGRLNQPIAKPMQVSSWRLVSGLHLAKGRPLGGNQAMGSKPVEPDRRCLHPVYV